MKKSLFIALTAAFLSLAASPPAQALEPGINVEIWDIMKTRADAMRIKSLAYHRALVSRNNSSLGLTCYDQQLKISSALSSIFSDNIPAGAAPPSPAYQGTILYPDRGKSNTLPGALGTVVNPMLAQMLMNFNDSLALALGAGTSIFANWLTSWLQTWMQSQFGWTPPIPSIDCNRLAQLWNDNVLMHGKAIEGSGIPQGAYHLGYADMVLGNTLSMGPDFIKQLQNDRDILQKALGDMKKMKPGGLPSWPTAPTFSRDATVQDIVRSM